MMGNKLWNSKYISIKNIYILYIKNYISAGSYSAANKGRSTVTYRKSLAFDRPYLSCNDHGDRWLFREIYLYHFQKQPYADVLQNRCYWKFRNIHRKTSVLASLFNKVAGLRPTTLFQPCTKRDFNTGVFLWKLWTFFWLLLLVWKSNFSIVISICQSFLNQKQKMWNGFY